MKSFTVYFKDLADEKKNPGFRLSVKSILKNDKIPKKWLTYNNYKWKKIWLVLAWTIPIGIILWIIVITIIVEGIL